MSGHSKWATIKRKKGANDAARGKVFTKFAREIQLAAREGADPNFNFRLRLIIDKAKSQNMPKDNIERAVKRGAGIGEDGTQLEEVNYEGYGPHGVALYMQTVTDNRNRTVSEMRRSLTRGGGSLGESGSVGWLFENKGVITIPMEKLNQDKVFELALEAGAEDVQFGDEEALIYTNPEDLLAVRQAFQNAKLPISDAELTMVPKTYVTLSPADTLQVMNLIENLEDLDDIVKVYSNLEITEEALAKLEGMSTAILGIDPGTATTGYAVVSENPDGSIRLIRYGVILTPAGAPMPERLLMIHQAVSALITELQPANLAIEELFFSRNVTTALTVGQARGVVVLAAAQAKMRVFEYKPSEVKQALVGYGNATKHQVQEMVRMMLGLDSIPRPDDAADAIAVAICHLHSVRLRSLEDT